MKQQTKAYGYAGIAIFFWSTVASAFKIALRDLDPVQLLFVASAVSFVLLTFINLFRGNLIRNFHYERKNWIRSAFFGFLNPYLYYLVLFKAYSLLPAQVAQPVNMIWPIVLVFLSVPLLNQKIPLRSFIALFISFSGVYLIASEGDPFGFEITEPFGLSLAIGSAFIWSFFWILNLRDRREALEKLLLNFFFATIYAGITVLVAGRTDISTGTGFLAAVYTGCFEMGISFVFWLGALKYSRTTDQVSNLIYLAPFLSLVLIHHLVGEQIHLTTIIGLILIIAGIFYQKFRLKK